MPTYRVWAKRTEYEYIDVEAKGADEAVRKAEGDEGCDLWAWKPIDDNTWEIVPEETEELDEAGIPIALGAD